MSWVEWLVALGCCVLAVRGGFFLLGAWREWRRSSQDSPAMARWQPMVSVVIPARNEERTIARCIHSVMACSYPHFEVIVVDDDSSDGTPAVLQQLQAQYGERLRVERRCGDAPTPNLQGKAGALHRGIQQARGEILLMTDADCRVPPSWIEAMVAPFRNPAVGFVAGVTLVEGQGFFAQLQSAEWLLLSVAGSGAVGWEQVLGCFGTNLAVRARAYWETGGYEQIPFSVTEDLALQQAIVRAGWQQRYRVTPEVLVSTLPVLTLDDRLRQLQRWGRGGLTLGAWAVAFVLTTVVFWSALIAALSAGQWLGAVGMLLLRVGIESALGVFGLRLLQQWQLLPMLPVAVLWLALVELVLPVLVLTQSGVRWKGRLLR